MIGRVESEQNDLQQNFQHPKTHDICNPPLMKATEDNLAEVFAKDEFLECLKSLEAKLGNQLATKCAYKFTRLLQESIKDMAGKSKKNVTN